MNDERIPVAVLGATGSVGQRFVQLLHHHPWFRLSELVASERSAGRRYRDATDWRLDASMPGDAADLKVRDYYAPLDSPIIFSALPSDVAGEIEQRMAKEGHAVLSNTSTHRMDPDVPLLIPEVNADHVHAIESQRQNRGWSGFIATNPNCSTIHMVLALKPLQQSFGLDAVAVTTLQAVSGAGYPGVPSLDMIDNVVPYIGEEEDKMETETKKLLGGYDGAFQPAEMVISAQCNRVPVRDGHTECISVRLGRDVSPDEVIEAFNAFRGRPQELDLPSAPPQPVIVRSEANRPQPALDRDTAKGMASVVGRVRPCPLMGIKFVVLGHNTVRGAAGASILNAELFREEGLLPV
ncbi:MAG TPA: aspartate-semialdehyde dehydrogenase [Thermomicrobiales bacterium]|nr:aspartate-semialdehyde dehydrogenase [Thermomicrobiales bacterium]